MQQVVVIHGGYGSSMSSNYNMREFAAEVLVEGDVSRLTRRRQTYGDFTTQFVCHGQETLKTLQERGLMLGYLLADAEAHLFTEHSPL